MEQHGASSMKKTSFLQMLGGQNINHRPAGFGAQNAFMQSLGTGIMRKVYEGQKPSPRGTNNHSNILIEDR